MKLFTVHDSASDTYIPPFCQKTERDAIEGFRYVVNNEKDSNYYKFPEDFTLMCLGSFDEQAGAIQLELEKRVIVNASKLTTVEQRRDAVNNRKKN